MLAMAADAVAGMKECRLVDDVYVVTDDTDVTKLAYALSAKVVHDPGTGMNAAIGRGEQSARRNQPHSGIAAVMADLPALSPGALDEALLAAAIWPRAFLPDMSGTGTTLLTARPGVELEPRFGVDSCNRHEASGAVRLMGRDLVGLRQDVDTEADIGAATRLGLGPATRARLKAGTTSDGNRVAGNVR
jgi:2-phospho-L-lactate guanylyltransferase